MVKETYHETKADNTESQSPIECFSGCIRQRGFEHAWANWVPHFEVLIWGKRFNY
jgi:hypothetical protein